MVIPYVFKKCTKCGRLLVASSENFHKDKKGKYGLKSKCKECCKKYKEVNREAIAEYDKKRYEKNKDAILKRNKKYREENKDAIAKLSKKYYEEHKEARAEYAKKYRNTPQGQIAYFNSRNRRRAREQAQGNGITKEQWFECMSFFEFRCAYSGKYIGGDSKDRTIDHIEPLNKGGEHEIWNLVPMYKYYNFSKKDKDLLTWYPKQEYFSKERLAKIYEWQEYAFNKWGRENLTEAE